MSEFKLRFATDELERAQRAQEVMRLAWLVARAARPAEVDIESMGAYCEAANGAALAQVAYDLAVMESQAEWHAEWRANHAAQRDREVEQAAGRSLPDLDGSPAETLSPVARQVRSIAQIQLRSRED